MAAKCIGFVHHKGGTGKTTSCINIAGELAKRGKKVLVIDVDPQGSATLGLGIDRNSIKNSMYDVFLARCENSNFPGIRDVIVETDINNIDIAPADIDLAGIPILMQKKTNPSRMLNNIIEDVRNDYDYIAIDTPPGYCLLSINGIIASDHLILPVDAGVFSMESIETFSTLLRDIKEELGIKKKIDTIIVTEFGEVSTDSIFSRLIRYIKNINNYNNYNSSLSIEKGKLNRNRNIIDGIRERIDLFLSVNGIFHGGIFVVPYSKAIRDAQMIGVPLSYSSPSSKINDIYANIAEKILGGN